MKTAYIKYSSYTQQIALDLQLAKGKVLQQAKLSEVQHELLMFEFGCRFVEHNIQNKHDQLKVLCNPAFGFWQWWRVTWARDDEGLVKWNSFQDGVGYDKMKEYMITSLLLKNQLLNILIHR